MCGSRRRGRDTDAKAASAPPSGAAPALTQHICRPVPGHEAGVIPVAHAFLEDALAEIFAKATAGCHQAVVTGVRLREAAQDCPGHQPAIGEHREHGVGRPAAQSQERGEPPAQPPPDLPAPAAGSQPSSPARRPARLSLRRPALPLLGPAPRPPTHPPPRAASPLRAGSRPRPRRPRCPSRPTRRPLTAGLAGSAPAFRAATTTTTNPPPPPRGGLCLLPGRPALPRKGLRAPSRRAVGWPGQSRRCPLRRPRTPPAAAAIFAARAEAPALGERANERATRSAPPRPAPSALAQQPATASLASRRVSFACCGTITPAGSRQPPRRRRLRHGPPRPLPPPALSPQRPGEAASEPRGPQTGASAGSGGDGSPACCVFHL